MRSSIYLRLLSFLKPYMKQVVFVWLIIAAAAAFTMIQPKLLQWAVDTGLKPPKLVEIGTTVTGNVSQGDTTLTAADGSKIQTDQVIGIDNEKMRVTAVSPARP